MSKQIYKTKIFDGLQIGVDIDEWLNGGYKNGNDTSNIVIEGYVTVGDKIIITASWLIHNA